MNDQLLNDQDIMYPSDDLFDMSIYAEKLSIYLETVITPFTVGVYGKWGEGKTSFVNLLKYYLTKGDKASSTVFIKFSAWQYGSLDALWRALIIKIAQDLYGYSDENLNNLLNRQETFYNEPSSFRESMKKALLKEFVVLQPNWQQPDENELKKRAFFNLIAKLDKTDGEILSRSADGDSSTISQDFILSSSLKAAMLAFGAYNSWFTGISDFFGIGKKIDLSKINNDDKGVKKRQMIQSMDDFKNAFVEMIQDRARGKTVFIFIDDLDRCLPDVALSILEAVKIFLSVKNCVFIVAADQQLIGQGLKLRFRDLINGSEERDFFLQKGREYFEKIIQFSVNIPPKSTEDLHRFITAQFPKWTSTTDIVQIALGANARRIKQYYNTLSYRYLVYSSKILTDVTPAQQYIRLSQEEQLVLEKLVLINAWDHAKKLEEKCLPKLRELAESILKKKLGEVSAQKEFQKGIDKIKNELSATFNKQKAPEGTYHRSKRN